MLCGYRSTQTPHSSCRNPITDSFGEHEPWSLEAIMTSRATLRRGVGYEMMSGSDLEDGVKLASTFRSDKHVWILENLAQQRLIYKCFSIGEVYSDHGSKLPPCYWYCHYPRRTNQSTNMRECDLILSATQKNNVSSAIHMMLFFGLVCWYLTLMHWGENDSSNGIIYA